MLGGRLRYENTHIQPMFKTAGDQRRKKTLNYHNPTRQRGIYREIGKSLKRNPQLTFWVVMAAGSTQLWVRNSSLAAQECNLFMSTDSTPFPRPVAANPSRLPESSRSYSRVA